MISEAALAAAISTWMTSEGWEVFREVSLEWKLRGQHTIGDGRADLVGLRDGQLSVVEVKRELSLDLLGQGKRWLPYANIVWIAFPHAKPSRSRDAAFSIARDLGLGKLEVRDDEIKTWGSPVVRTSIDDALRESLRPGHQTHAEAGTNRGGQFTTFRGTADALAAYVAANPGCTLAEAVEGTPHHYRSKSGAAGALARSIRKGLVPGVHVGWKQRLFPTEEGARRGFEMGDEAP